MVQRVSGTLLAISALLVSLLAFPAGIPWMIAFWLLIHTALVLRKRPGWVPLLIFPLILLIKGMYWMPGLMLVTVVSLLAGIRRTRQTQQDREEIGIRTRGVLVVVWLAWGVMTADWWLSSTTSRKPPLDISRPVACLGDSLTSFGYPQRLEAMLAIPVADFGADGITSQDGVERLQDVLSTRPQALAIELGGHDFLKSQSREATRANLEQIVTTCRSAGCEPVLVEIPRGFIFDTYQGLERQIAREFDLELVSDTAIRKFVLLGPHAPPGIWLGRNSHLSDDGLHPNSRGNEVLATAVAAALARLFGPHVLAP